MQMKRKERVAKGTNEKRREKVEMLRTKIIMNKILCSV